MELPNGDAEKGIPQHIPKKMANQELSKESELKEEKNEKKRKWDLPRDRYRTCSVCKRVKQGNQRFLGRPKLHYKRKGWVAKKGQKKKKKRREAQKRRDFLDKKTISKSVVKRKKKY